MLGAFVGAVVAAWKKRKGLLSVGDRVSAYFNGMFYPCTITRVRRNKQYDILYDDGETDTKKSIDLMRRIPTDGVRKANDEGGNDWYDTQKELVKEDLK